MRRLSPHHLLLALALVACTDGTDGTDDTDAVDTDGTDTDGVDTDDDFQTVPGVTCNANKVCILSGTIADDFTLTPDRTWLLRGGVFIGDEDLGGTILTIQPGTTVYGESATDGFLAVRRGSQLRAEGRADAPIVFTSDQPEGSRARGQWGGLVLLGKAPINGCDTQPCEAEIEGGAGTYGGGDPNDSSGSLKYVRIEYGGTEVSKDNELNGLTLGGVGKGTTLEHVQIHMNLDDGIEFFGGTVDVKHLVVSCAGDDSIDWDLGWKGRIQHALVVQCDDAGNNGIEADNNEANHGATPFSDPVLSNLTFVGSTAIPDTGVGILLRRGTGARIHNSVVTGFKTACLDVRDQTTWDRFDGTSTFANNVLACATTYARTEAQDIFEAGTGNTVVADAELGSDHVPETGSPAATGGAAVGDAWFETTSYRGAFDPSGTVWTTGWTSFDAN